MTAYKYGELVKKGLGGELSPQELEVAMRLCGEGKPAGEAIKLLQQTRDRKANKP